MTFRFPAPLAVALAGALFLGGCPKKGPSLDEDQMANPVYVFEAAKRTLEPDRKGNVDYASAYDLFRKVAVELDGGPKAHFNAGWTAERLGELDAATDHYRKAFEADPEYTAAMYSLARLYKSQDQPGEAASVYATYLEAHPDDLEVRTEYMDALVGAEQYDAAIAQGEEILRTDPNSDAVYRSLSGLYLKKGQLDMAQIMGDKALELNDADPNVYNNMGVVYLQQDDLPGAIDKFKMAKKLDSGHYEANMNLGLIALDSGDYTLALECFDKALERNPASLDARLSRAVALRGTGDYDAAEKVYDDLIKERPELDTAYFNASTLHEKYTKDFAKALKYLEAYKDSRAGELSPDDPVFRRMERVAAAKAEEDERKRLEAERKREEEERRRRARETLAAMEELVASTMVRLDDNADCIPEEVSMEVGMILEEVASVIDAEDTEMATEVKQMLDDYYLPMLDTAIEDNCGAGAPPEGEGDEAMDGDDTMEGDTSEGDTAEEADDAEATDEAAPEE